MHLTLDGVMQAPGRPDEDQRDGFVHGGWAAPRGAAVAEAIGVVGQNAALLLGRRTYEDFYAFWPRQQHNQFTDRLNQMQKYVASTTLSEPLPWSSSTLLRGDAAQAVAGLKQQLGTDLLVMGSGELLRSLMQHRVIDEYMLLIHPLVLGTGRRLFAAGSPPAMLRLIESKSTDSSVLIARYVPDDQANNSKEQPA